MILGEINSFKWGHAYTAIHIRASVWHTMWNKNSIWHIEVLISMERMLTARERGKSVIHLIDITGSSWKKWERETEKEKERASEREHPFSPDNSSVQRSPSNRTLHLFTAEMRLDSISRSIWFRREGASQPISKVLVGNVYHLLAVRTYALCGAVIRSPGEKHKQLIVGRWWSDGGRGASGGIGRRTGRWISGS